MNICRPELDRVDRPISAFFVERHRICGDERLDSPRALIPCERLGETNHHPAEATSLPWLVDRDPAQICNLTGHIYSHDPEIIGAMHQELGKISRLVFIGMIRVILPEYPAILEKDRPANPVVGCPPLRVGRRDQVRV